MEIRTVLNTETYKNRSDQFIKHNKIKAEIKHLKKVQFNLSSSANPEYRILKNTSDKFKDSEKAKKPNLAVE